MENNRSSLGQMLNILAIAGGLIALLYFTPIRATVVRRYYLWRREAKCSVFTDFNLCGQVMGSSSNPLLPDSPLKKVFILAIPESNLENLLGEKTFAWLKKPENLMFVIATHESFEKNVIQVTKPQPNGIYVLNLPVGYYLLCLANLGHSGEDPIVPASVVGCLGTEITSRGQTTFDIRWGKEGIIAPN